MSTEIGKLIAVFEADTRNFDAGTRRVEASMRSAAQTVSTSQKQISQSTTRGMKDIGAGGLTLRQELSAVASLQRQKSASIIRDWKAQERAAKQLASGVLPVGTNLQKITDIMQALGSSSATLQGPMGGVASRLRSLGAVASEASGGLGLVGAAVGALLVATVAAGVGIYKLVVASAEATGKFHDLSQQTGFSVETLSALGNAAETSGGSIESITNALFIFETKMGEAKDTGSDIGKMFKALSIDTTNNEKALRQSISTLLAMNNAEDRAMVGKKLFGRSVKDLIGAIKEAGGLDAFLNKQLKDGTLITTEAAKRGDQLTDSITILGQKVSAVGRSVASEFAPMVSDGLSQFSRWLKDNQRELVSTAKGVATLIKDIGNLASFIYSISPIRLQVEILRTVKTIVDDFQGPKGKDVPTGSSLFDQLRGFMERGPTPTGTGGGLGRVDMSKVAAQTKEQITATAKGNNDAVKQAAAEQKKLQDALKGLSSNKGGGGGKGQSALERASKQALEMSRIQLRGAESVYRDALEKEQAYYGQSLTSLETYSRKRIELENERYDAQREVFTKEQQLISTGAFKPGERTVKQAELNQSIEDAERKHFATLRSIRADDKREQQDADKRHNDAVISLHEDGLKSLESSLLRAVSVRKKTAVQAEEEMFAAMQAVLTEKGEKLQEELGRVLMNPNQAREVQDQIDALNLEMEQRAKEHVHKLDDARQEDVQSAIDYSRQLRTVADDIIANDLDTARIRLQAIRDNTLYRTEAIREEARIEKAAEQQRTASTVQDLRERKRLIKAEADALKSDPFEAVRQMKAIDQQIAAIQRNSAARQVEIQRQAQEQIVEKWREVSRDITDILSAGITGGFKGALDSVKQVLDQISKEILNSAIIKILQPNAPNQGSQAGGIIGAITNKILGAIGLGAPKPTPPGITLARGDERRPRVVGEPDTLAQVSTVGDRIAVSQTRATGELNRARTEQTQQLLSSLNGIAEHLCQCSKSPQESLKDTIGSVISAGMSLIPTRGSNTRPNVSSVVRDIPEAGGVVLPGGGTGGATRPRIVGPQVTPTTVNDASKSISTSITGQTRERTVTSQTQTQDLKNTIQLTGQQIVQGLTPTQQGFGAGLLQAAIGGAISGLASGLTSGIGGSGGFNNEGPITPRPTVAPKMKFRASGGPVSAMTPYVVGEKGPEMFVPRSHGDIYNQQQMRNMGNEVHNHYTINLPSAPKGSYQSPKSKRELAETLIAALQSQS